MKVNLGIFILMVGLLGGMCEAGYKKASEVDLKDGSVEAMMVVFVKKAHLGKEECLNKITQKYKTKLKRRGAVSDYLNKFKELDFKKVFKLKEIEKDGEIQVKVLGAIKGTDNIRGITIICTKVDGAWMISG